MTDPDTLTDLSATQIAQRIADGETTAEAVTRACLDRITARDAEIKAFVHLDPEATLAEARARDNEAPRGPLHGVPVAIKDIIDVAGWPTGNGSPIWAGNRAFADAACVARLRAAGAVILGKTATTEFAAFTPTTTVNPHNQAHTPGGSSSGSAAAVAAGMVPLALGTQTMGSVIRPAAYCGIVGLKPSFGTIVRVGVKETSDSLDTVGLFARSVEDLAPALTSAAGVVGSDPNPYEYTVTDPIAVGVFRGPDWDRAAPAAVKAVDDAAAALDRRGNEVREIDPPELVAEAMAAHWTIAIYEIARALSWEAETHGDRISPKLRDAIEDGLAVAPHAYQSARGTAERARRWFADRFKDIDVLLTVSAPGEAPKGLASTGDPVFNRLWTLLHLPCATLPAGAGPNGLPIGIQLVGPPPPLGDGKLIGCARWVAASLG